MSQFLWKQSGNLGSLIAGEISEFTVQLTTSTYNLSYKIQSGILPPTLNLNRDGSISGFGAFSTATTSTIYNFTVDAVDVYGTTSTSTAVSITLNQTTSTEFTRLYCRPFLHPAKRAEFNSFITDPRIFSTDSIYRPLDPNFGIQKELKLFIEFGIKKLSIAEFYAILQRNFYKRRFVLDPLRFARTADNRYEVIYLDVMDKYSDYFTGETVPSQITMNGVVYYPAGIANMRQRIESQTDTTTRLDPKFMTKYIKIVPLCYTLPGKSLDIIKKIKASGFKFNTIDFEIDRMIVENSIENSGAKYLMLNQNYPLA